jgi:catechol 2,3-dioxygenase-like lactoylglutathione lyase family enzyme
VVGAALGARGTGTVRGYVGIAPSESFVILYHEDMPAARRFYEEILGLELREVTYEWFVGYWISDKHEMTLCISSSPEERAKWGAAGRGVVVDFVVSDVDGAYRHLVERGVLFDEPPTDKPWGLRTASLRDPAGYTLTITSYPPGGKGSDRREPMPPSPSPLTQGRGSQLPSLG